MSHVRTLVVAVWVVFTTAVFLVDAAPAATAPRTADAVDATGAADVTADLQALIDRTPDGGVVQLGAGGDYRVEGTLLLENRHDLRIEGNGSRIFATTVGDGSRIHLRIVGGSHLGVRNLEIRGANPHAGLDDRAYVEALAGQHGIRIDGASDIELDGVRVSDVYGDFVYMGKSQQRDRRWTERVWIHDSTFTRSGRQGLTVTAGRDVVIERNTINDVRMGSIDMEPHPSFGAENIHILDNVIGPARLLFVAASGHGRVNTVVIEGNVLRGDNLTFWVMPPEATRRQRFWVVDNTSDAPATSPPLQFTRVDGVVVTGNRQPVTSPSEALVQAVDSCGVSVGGNDIAPGTMALSGEGPACGFNLPLEPPEPPAVAGRGQESAAPAPPPSPTTEAAPPPTTTTIAPTTQAPTTTTIAPTTEAPATAEPEVASATRDGGAGTNWLIVIAAVVLVLAGGVAAVARISARRGRPSAARHRSPR
jgi:hypothetical protein